MQKYLHSHAFTATGLVVLAFLIACVCGVFYSGLSVDAAEKEQYEIYVLKAGEGLSTVAEKYDVPLQRIIELNRDRLPDRNNPDRVFRGMQVRVPVKKSAAQPSSASSAPKAASAPEAPPNKSNSAAGSQFTLQPAQGNVSPDDSPAAPPVATSQKEPEAGSVKPTEKPEPDATVKDEPRPEPEPPVLPADSTAVKMPDEPMERGGAMAAWYGSLSPGDPMFWFLAIIVALLAIIVLSVVVLLFRTYTGRTIIDVRDTGKLRLVAARELGKNARLFWFKAGEQDVFVSTGSDAQIVTADIAGVKEEMEKPEKPAPAPRSSTTTRRTRKSQPAPATDKPESNLESTPPEDTQAPTPEEPGEQTGN